MQDTLTPSFLMEDGTYNLQGLTEEEIIRWNRMMNMIDEIFDRELALPDYYEEKNLHGGVEWIRCGILIRMT